MRRAAPSEPAPSAFSVSRFGRLLHLRLTQPHQEGTGSQGISRLEGLANDPAFHFHPHGFEHRLPRPRPLSESGSKSQPLTATSPGDGARHRLRSLGFSLACAGLSFPAGSSPVRPCAALDEHPSLSLANPIVSAAFGRHAKQVDLLLSAVDRARGWTEDRLRQLVLGPDPSDRRQALDYLFGPDLSADVVIETLMSVGLGGARIGQAEALFNAGLNESTIASVNAILVLVEVARQEDGGSAGQSTFVTGSEGSDEEQEDHCAAATLLKACQRWHRRKQLLTFVTAERVMDFHERYHAALAHAKPDWVLVFGQEGSYEVLAVIESKPRADRKALLQLAKRRLDPLGISPIPESQLIQNKSSAQDASSSGRRSMPRDYTERKEPSLRQQRLADVLRDEDRPPMYGYADSEAYQKLLLQLTSQMVLCNVRHALIWACWGRLLLPASLSTGSDSEAEDGSNQLSNCSLSFSPMALSTAEPLIDVHSSSASGSTPSIGTSASADSEEDFSLHSRPNIVMALVQWALFVEQEVLTQGRLRPDLLQSLSRMTEEDVTEDERGDAKSTGRGRGDRPRRRRRSEDGGGDGGNHASDGKRQRRGGQDTTLCEDSDSVPTSSSMESIGDGDHGRAQALDDGTGSSPPSSPIRPASAQVKVAQLVVTSPSSHERRTVNRFAFARGRYAQVHRGVISRPGQPELPCIYKVNRPRARMTDDLDNWDQPEDQVDGPLHRFEKERDVLQSLQQLQGSVLPRLLGVSPAHAITSPGDAPALILEDVGQPIDWWARWPSSLSNRERRKLVQDAYKALHHAGWLHSDVAPRNVLFSVAAKTSEDAGEVPDVRVCIVDLARAERRPADPAHDASRLRGEDEEVALMLDDLFPLELSE